MFDSIPKRYVFSLVGLSATTLSIALQTNLSIAIVYMVQRTSFENSSNENPDKCIESPHIGFNNTDILQVTRERLDWSPEIQGIALSAQFVGVTLGYIPGGRLAEVYGAKTTMLYTLFLSSLSTALLPIAAHISVYLFIACRIVVGIGASPIFPALIYMIYRWIPTSEQSFISSFIFAGYGTGAFVSYVTAGALCSSDFLEGWPSVFYCGALCGFIWCIWCYIVVYDSPDLHPTISLKEMEFIRRNTNSQIKQLKSVPWKSMATSVPFWALVFGTFGQYWILSFFITSLAMYMGTILNLRSFENGLLSCVPNLLRAVCACIVGLAIDFVMQGRNIPIVYIRKGVTLVNSLAACIGFTGILFAGCDITINTICFIIAGSLNDFYIFGVGLAPLDMAPNLAGTLSGILSFLSSAPYIILPTMIGTLTKYERTMSQWRHVYYCNIGVTVVTTVIYLWFGTSDLQPWNIEPENLICDPKPRRKQ